ncbi:hypothetical protein UPYG_G00030820 [Umbra pygmaea]|uniref:Leucine-rich repeat-containing protein 41 n=1 Tax=Umbra pygmaea TaxID=75934 RepID=A0ABD0XMQ6_UMBPY
MFVPYLEQIRRANDIRMAKVTSTNTPSLKELCLKTVSRHMDVLDKKAIDLPVSLIKELLPHLNIIDLDRIQPAVNGRGVSTSFVWAGILREITGPRKVSARLTEEEWREKIMNKLFNMAFYGLRFRGDAKYLLNVNFNALLLVMAKYIQHLPVYRTSPHCGFINQRAVLNILEKTVKCIKLEVNNQLRELPRDFLYALHRLLDHGEAREIIIRHSPDPRLLAWILHGRGPQGTRHQCPMESNHEDMKPGEPTAETTGACVELEEEEPDKDGKEEFEDGTPSKRPRLNIASVKEQLEGATCQCQCMEPKPLCQMFGPSASPSRLSCPKGQIHSLAMNYARDGILPVLFPLLPSWLCLRSLSLHSAWTFEAVDALRLAECLQQLSKRQGCSLTELSVGCLPNPALMESLLNGCPTLRSFSMEIHPVAEFHKAPMGRIPLPAQHTDLSLEKLCVKVPNLTTNMGSLLRVLKRCPHLTSLHVSGISRSPVFSPSHLINTVAVSNRQLKELILEEINLSDCHSVISQLMDNNCVLEALSLKDCRLLEKCSEKDDVLRQLVSSVRSASSLQSLNLSQNRLAKNVKVLAELFIGPSPSTLKELNISSNFIKPSELLELGRLLEAHRPPQNLLLTVKSNPLDRDLAVRDVALGTLSQLCELITDHWNSRDTMADHISSM